MSLTRRLSFSASFVEVALAIKRISGPIRSNPTPLKVFIRTGLHQISSQCKDRLRDWLKSMPCTRVLKSWTSKQFSIYKNLANTHIAEMVLSQQLVSAMFLKISILMELDALMKAGRIWLQLLLTIWWTSWIFLTLRSLKAGK